MEKEKEKKTGSLEDREVKSVKTKRKMEGFQGEGKVLQTGVLEKTLQMIVLAAMLP